MNTDHVPKFFLNGTRFRDILHLSVIHSLLGDRHVCRFDTLKCVETLKASGFDESQARGMSAAIQEVQKSNLDGLVTRVVPD